MYATYFPDPAHVVLLVKPFATRVSVGGFFFREDGKVHSESTHLEFPFRRKELGGEPTRPEQAPGEMREPPPRTRPPASEPDISAVESPQAAPAAAQPPSAPVEALAPQPPAASLKTVETAPSGRLRSGWVWIPLSFIFLLLGVVLGFQVAISVRSQIPSKTAAVDPYALGLTVTQSGDSLHVRWNRASSAIRSARGGALIISDRGNQKTVNLDPGQLQNGSIIYRQASNDVRFRLEVFATDRNTISESMQYQVDASPAQ
jgi:hypothetical protein